MLHVRASLYLVCGSVLLGCSDSGGGGTTEATSSASATTSSTTAPTTEPTSTPTTEPTTEPLPTTGGLDGTSTGTEGSVTTQADTSTGTTVTSSTGTTMGVSESEGTTVAPEMTGSSGPGESTSTGGTTDGSSSTGEPPTKCDPTPPIAPAGDCEAIGILLQPPYADNYTCYDLGVLPGVPTEWGGLIIDRKDPNILLAGGDANTIDGKLYAVTIARDADCHILGYQNVPTQVGGAAEYNDGGLSYHSDLGPMFLSRWPVNQLGQLKDGDIATSKVIDLAPLGVVSSPGGVTFVPPGFAAEGQLKAVSWPGGEWYTLDLVADGLGTFNVTKATLNTKIVGGPEAFVYISDENPEFPVDGFLVAEWSAGNIAAYDADGQGNPLPATRKDFIKGLAGAESAYIDPLSGDFLFATFAGSERLVVIRGFVPQPQ